LKLDPLLALIISAPNFDHFTISDLCSAYIFLKKPKNLDPIVVHRKLYPELLKLVNKGFLKKLGTNQKGLIRFNKTELFTTKALSLEVINKQSTPKLVDEKKQKYLIKMLTGYKAELLLNIGKIEAYNELSLELPKLVTEIQPKYNNTRDNNTKLLGKIKAIEDLLIPK
jgi:hypothetical protein